MMQSRLKASLSLLSAGSRKSSICTSILAKPRLTLFHAESRSNRFLLQGLEILQQSIHSCSDNEDDFSELGTPVGQGTGTLQKLVTEKPEPFLKSNPARKAKGGRSSPAESSIKDNCLNLEKASPALRSKHENHNDISRFSGNPKAASIFQISSSVAVENVPSLVELSQLIKTISIYGEIATTSTRTLPDGRYCCYIKFENVGSSKQAISGGGIIVGKFWLPIRPLHIHETVTIRINCISKETCHPAILSVCKSIGALEELVRASEDAVDALFVLNGESDSESILSKLNNTIIDNRRWSARILPRDSIPAAVSEKENVKRDLTQQISKHLGALRLQFNMKKISAEDLENLHVSILHLDDHPVINS